MSGCGRGTRRRAAAAALMVALGAVVGASADAPVPRPGVLRDLAYAGDPDPDRSLDLYLPAASSEAPPLLAFLDSQFWTRRAPERSLETHVARPLQAEGAAVAVIRHRLAPAHAHPAAAEDVAAALAFLVKGAARYGYDPARIVLAGHSSGAHLAALVALDPRYLAPHALAPGVLAGVVGISGLYDLDPARDLDDEQEKLYRQAFGRRRHRRAASPARLPRADAPPFLVLTAGDDIPGLHREGMDFTEALRGAGHGDAETFMIVGRDHFSILALDDTRNGARGHLLSFLGLGPHSAALADLYAARKYWRAPEASTLPFWQDRSRVETYDADERFLVQLALPFVSAGRAAPLVEADRYHAVDLFAYLEASDPEGLAAARFVTLTNERGEQRVWRLEAIRPYAPVIAIGVDDEHDLFRILDVYFRRREATGSDAAPAERILARPLGGFVHFREPPPRAWDAQLAGRFALSPDSFALSVDDPWQALRDLPPAMEEVLAEGEGCVSCHEFRGVGGRAGHLRARDGALVGGRGLPLASYAPEVWRRFLFEQADVARELGAPPVELDDDTARELYELVVQERARAQPGAASAETAPTRGPAVW